ncbi:MAG: hypothetical protein ACP5U1_02910 [Desulfomonilaceae bacterium]
MGSLGLFTETDRTTVDRAARLAESLVAQYFNLAHDDWIKNPYSLMTWKESAKYLRDTDVFAQTVRFDTRHTGKTQRAEKRDYYYGVLLADPTILRALLRPQRHDLWTLGLFVLTHELVHIVRFRKFGVDFFGTCDERKKEEDVVHKITREMLAGVESMDSLFSLYESGLKV